MLVHVTDGPLGLASWNGPYLYIAGMREPYSDMRTGSSATVFPSLKAARDALVAAIDDHDRRYPARADLREWYEGIRLTKVAP